MFLGIDTGGTFTDFVYFDGIHLRFLKVLSTPDDPSQAILKGIREMDADRALIEVIHGSTVATNAILEHKGVKTLFVTNRGLEDILFIGRQNRTEIYELSPEPGIRWLDPEDCIGISGRVDAEGRVIEEIEPADLDMLRERCESYTAVACCTLFSFLNPEQERSVAGAILGKKFLSLSHRILPEYREYERAATTFLNAYIGPLTRNYLRRLNSRLGARGLLIMHSAGGVMSTEQAGRQAVRMILSGPAGGLVAAKTVGRQLGKERLITFDMGGTSTDVALINHDPGITIDGSIAGLPVAMPMLDIHTIGAGGGSIAWFDEAGILHAGPESAGADPGPVCYGRGGSRITVTDANLILGRIPADIRMAGTLPVDIDSARRFMAAMAKENGLTPELLAQGILRIAEENMAGALRVVSVQRGYDPGRFALVCFGGAGGLHACSLAGRLGIRQIIYPLASGAFSALGMLAGKRQGDFSRSRRLNITAEDARETVREIFSALEEEARINMPNLELVFEHFVDLRFEGQGFHLTLPYTDQTARLARDFLAAHEQAYGHILENHSIEIMTCRLRATYETRDITWPELPPMDRAIRPDGYSSVYGTGKTPHYQRYRLRPGHKISGPAIILEETATLWLPEEWHCSVSTYGHLLLLRSVEL